MDKIKPVVIGFNRVFTSGRIGALLFEIKRLNEVSIAPREYRDMLVFKSNGKPKFRLVYKEGNEENEKN